jgi:hypothetical protein
MPGPTENASWSSLATLRQFARKPREQTEACELCAAPLSSRHWHLLEVEKHRIVCACQACVVLFGGHAQQRYRRVPRDVSVLSDFHLDDQEWESLLIPINLAFFVRSSAAGRVVAQYPSPGGVMESTLDLDYWKEIVARNSVLNELEPDVEALLVNRIATPPQYYRAPIDQCFRLVGVLRTHWRGLSGGEEVWKEIGRFFEELQIAAEEGQLA